MTSLAMGPGWPRDRTTRSPAMPWTYRRVRAVRVVDGRHRDLGSQPAHDLGGFGITGQPRADRHNIHSPGVVAEGLQAGERECAPFGLRARQRHLLRELDLEHVVQAGGD